MKELGIVLFLELCVGNFVWSGEPIGKSDGFNFLVIGDWGGMPFTPYRTYIERAVAGRMGKVAGTVNAQFVVALGDNFYYDGVADLEDPRFQETYENVYVAQSLQIPWYVVAGNHDHHRNVSAQILYSQKSKRWNFPNYYYTKTFKLPGMSKVLQLVLIDTVVLCGNTGHDHFHNQPKGPRSPKEAAAELEWLENTLKSSTADFLLVGGHYPVWSVAEHGPTHCLVSMLKPLLEKYGVTAYLCGHDHNLQHLKENSSSVEYFVSGCANFINSSTKHMDSVPKGALKFHWADISKFGGFAVVNIKGEEMTLTFIDSFGETLYTHKVLSRNSSTLQNDI